MRERREENQALIAQSEQYASGFSPSSCIIIIIFCVASGLTAIPALIHAISNNTIFPPPPNFGFWSRDELIDLEPAVNETSLSL